MLKKLFSFLIICFSSGFLIGLTGCAPTPTSESTGQYIDNSIITAKVKAALLNDKEIPSHDITVNSYKGVVQLSGFVDDQQQLILAGQIASQVDGVTQVRNDLIVR